MLRMRKHLTYANVMVTSAVVFAMTGGAYAASKYVISTTKQINPKVLTALKGKAGANGVQGSAGPVGPVGPAGAVGEKGETGPAGQNGAPGEKGAQGEKGTAGTNGFNGSTGAKGPAGPTGPTGVTGSPWTDGGTLPVGSTETGQWSFGGIRSLFVTASISFPIPLEKALDQEHSIFVGPEEGEGEPKFVQKEDGNQVREAFEHKECSGNVKEPKAASGALCVFANEATEFKAGLQTIPIIGGGLYDAETGETETHAGKSGGWLRLEVGGEEGVPIWGSGDWVVTG
jgi:hypothetical protein